MFAQMENLSDRKGKKPQPSDCVLGAQSTPFKFSCRGQGGEPGGRVQLSEPVQFPGAPCLDGIVKATAPRSLSQAWPGDSVY